MIDRSRVSIEIVINIAFICSVGASDWSGEINDKLIIGIDIIGGERELIKGRGVRIEIGI